MQQDRLSLLLWVRENATSRSETSKRILLPGMNVLQQLSNSDDDIHWKVFDLLLGEH